MSYPIFAGFFGDFFKINLILMSFLGLFGYFRNIFSSKKKSEENLQYQQKNNQDDSISNKSEEKNNLQDKPKPHKGQSNNNVVGI